MTHSKKTKIIAHRGASSLAPENTLASIRSALKFKPNFIEIDVRLTKDEKLVVLHDASLKRTCGFSKTIHNLTLEEAKTFDAGKWFGKEFTGETIPTLEEVLETIGSQAGLMIEIKQGVLPPHVAVEKVFDVILGFQGALPKLVIGGFSLETATLTRKKADQMRDTIDIKTIGIVERYPCIAPFIKQNIDILAAWHKILIPDVTEELFKWTNGTDNELWSFTVNEQLLGKSLIDSGVTGLITNFPQLSFY